MSEIPAGDPADSSAGPAGRKPPSMYAVVIKARNEKGRLQSHWQIFTSKASAMTTYDRCLKYGHDVTLQVTECAWQDHTPTPPQEST